MAAIIAAGYASGRPYASPGGGASEAVRVVDLILNNKALAPDAGSWITRVPGYPIDKGSVTAVRLKSGAVYRHGGDNFWSDEC